MGDVVKIVRLPKLLMLPFTGPALTNVVRDESGYERNWVHPDITGNNFPWRDCFNECELVFLDFDRTEVSSEHVLSVARGFCSIEPSYEHALRLGLQCPKEHLQADMKYKYMLVFLHEPWVDPYGNHLVMCLHTDLGRRGIWLRQPLNGKNGKWAPYTRFGFLTPCSGG